jgi:hypothetical protein
MPTDDKKNNGIDMSQYFGGSKKIPRKFTSPNRDLSFAAGKKQNYLLVLLLANFALGILIFSYLISKSASSSSTAIVSLDQIRTPINYQLKPGQVYKLPLP